MEVLAEPTEPLTAPGTVLPLCNSLSNSGVMCHYKFLCGLEVMRRDMSC